MSAEGSTQKGILPRRSRSKASSQRNALTVQCSNYIPSQGVLMASGDTPCSAWACSMYVHLCRKLTHLLSLTDPLWSKRIGLCLVILFIGVSMGCTPCFFFASTNISLNVHNNFMFENSKRFFVTYFFFGISSIKFFYKRQIKSEGNQGGVNCGPHFPFFPAFPHLFFLNPTL